jgi:hypothetical protein
MEWSITPDIDLTTQRQSVAPRRGATNSPTALPDFLIISPPKTGSTWLAYNLQCHPDLFVAAVKEVRYFSLYHQWLDLSWYRKHFEEAGARLKGEASPSYSLLPCRAIRRIHALMPWVKLIFLMRDPVDRAWSHARHNYLHQEANFRGYKGALAAVAEDQWRENFGHAWPLASGDYLGQLRRWLAVFPREQIHVDRYESIKTDPEGLLSRVFAFLGVATKVDWSSFRVRETILPGMARPLPPGLRQELRLLFRERTWQLDAFLQTHFALSVREAWAETLGTDGCANGPTESPGPGSDLAACFTSVYQRECDDEWLTLLLDTEQQTSRLQVLAEGYHGYNVALYRGHFIAVPQTHGEVSEVLLEHILASGCPTADFVTGPSLEAVKEKVLQQIVWDLRHRLAHVEARERELTAHLEVSERALAAQLAECLAFVARIRNAWVFRARRALGCWVAGCLERLRARWHQADSAALAEKPTLTEVARSG